jgi:hypothetical protein
VTPLPPFIPKIDMSDPKRKFQEKYISFLVYKKCEVQKTNKTIFTLITPLFLTCIILATPIFRGTREVKAGQVKLLREHKCQYCPISFNSDKGVTCDSLSEILVSDTFQKGDDRVHPAARPTPKWTLNFHI